MYPNPATDMLHLSTSSNLSNASLHLKNLNGQEEKITIEASSHQASIDISSLPSGIYLLEIVFNESMLSKRIIKQ